VERESKIFRVKIEEERLKSKDKRVKSKDTMRDGISEE